MTRIALFLAAAAVFATAPTLAARAQGIDLPARKAGQWELRMVAEKPAGTPGMDAQMCLDAATDRDLMDFGLKMSKDSCKRYDIRRTGASWVIDAECAMGPIRSATKTTISGDFQSTVTVRIEGTTEGMPGAGKGPQATLMTQTARWIGACPEGMRPGDIAMAGGIKMNVKKLKRLEKLLSKVQVQ
jgi:hypothetical protein